MNDFSINPVSPIGPADLAPRAPAGDAPAGEVAKDFESLLIGKLLDAMSKTIPESGLLESGVTRQIEGMFWHYLAQEVAQGGGLGLAGQLEQHISEQAADAGQVGDEKEQDGIPDAE